MSDVGHSQSHLVTTLNQLLASLNIPIELTSPLDLTPSLLLAILESLVFSRLPISSAVRESQSPSSKVQAMKIFLGVLENDVLGMDVGLSELDPRRLASGEWEEVVYVGELLVWIGRKLKVTTEDDDEGYAGEREREGPPGRVHAGSPSTHSTVTNSIQTNLSMEESRTNHSDTSIATESTATTPVPWAPRCIHEVEEPSFNPLPHSASNPFVEDDSGESFAPDQSYCDCPTGTLSESRNTPVRFSGWIGKVDQDLELSSFEASRRPTRNAKTPPTRSWSHPEHSRNMPNYLVPKNSSPTGRTLTLLNERAKLLSELASLKVSR